MKPAKLVSRGDQSELVSLYPITAIKGPLGGTTELERQEPREPQPARPTGPLTSQHPLKNSRGDLRGQNTAVMCVQTNTCHHPGSSLQTPSGGLPRTPFPLFPSTGPESGSFRNQRCRGETTAQAHALAAGSGERPRTELHTPHPAPAARCPAPPAWHPPGPPALGPRLPSHPRFSGIPSKQTFAQDLKNAKAKCFHALWSLGRPPASEGLGGQGLHEAGTPALGTGGPPTASTRPSQAFPKPTAQKGRHSQSGLWKDVLI